jgi:hypothetical protein
MSAVLHLPVLNTQTPYMLKEKAVETFCICLYSGERTRVPTIPLRLYQCRWYKCASESSAALRAKAIRKRVPQWEHLYRRL